MSGRRPDTTNIYSFIGTFRNPDAGLHWVALPEHFVQNGYNVGGSGKLFHPNVPANFDQPYSWTVPYIEFGDNASNTCIEECCGIADFNATSMSEPRSENPPWHYCAWQLADGTYLSDQRNMFVARDHLRNFGAEYKSSGKPFFVGLGFHKPHLPVRAFFTVLSALAALLPFTNMNLVTPYPALLILTLHPTLALAPITHYYV